MRRGTVSAANKSPVPEKNIGRRGVSILNKRGLESEVAVEPIMVIFSTLSASDDRGAGEVVGSS